ncbi:molybdate ABC transporter substrate-binding protein [Cellulosimicrobium protaetiae]|uniref:Molybdate ABC transporter substrate-binding protein n=1 Tax=Cellulosimicrobium protaetiae TaxID=2587808 RepID=A0A6M5UBC9_9MICO|nr:molybdate ABC transporter substrate-binding protein [Cellulosimicrobium protaetiae]QJW35560.1 molybdate ABC transporter substrate-binding protein [Cellulosimicrobium protaetiae]
MSASARPRTTTRTTASRRRARGALAGLGTAVLVAALAACGTGGGAREDVASSDGATDPASTPAEERTLTVLAAASLRDVFTDLAGDFEAEHEGVTVALSFAGSSDLGDQILAGAPADVFASADERTMTRVVDAGDASDPVAFATNTLTVVTPPGNPAGVETFADLARDDVKVVVCAPEVPCGGATDTVAEAAGVTIHRVSEEANVTDVLAKVTSGEADAGLVYVTDATLAGDAVDVVDVPETDAALNVYPIALVAAAEEAGPEQVALARAWVDLVTGDAGQAALAAAGFGAPDAATP